MIPAMKAAAIAELLATTNLPVAAAVPKLRAALTNGNAVLTAPPGSGKTTLLPLALLNEPWLAEQRIIMLEPRRLAARGAAQRMAELLQQPVGETVGYSMRMERKLSQSTRIEVVTEGLLTRRLQHNPDLPGVGLVIFDELHERNLHADLALALCLDAQTGLRDEASPLRLLAMSATLDAAETSIALGHSVAGNSAPAPVITASGQSFPVDIRYCGGEPARQARDIARNVTAAVATALTEQAGSVLVFLPGRREIEACFTQLAGKVGNCQLLRLHGDLAAEEQRAAVKPLAAGERRVILSSAIAETSLTLPGIGAVIDSGLTRSAVYDPNSGFTRLQTRWVSRASATQRSGRAGRLGPGIAWRLWSEPLQGQLAEQQAPEIDTADLAPMRLELAHWGVSQPAEMRWLSPPPQANWQQAGDLLQQLKAITADGRITTLGTAMNALGVHPRLAAMLCRAPKPQRQNACDLAALLSERDVLNGSGDSDIERRLQLLQHWRSNPKAIGRNISGYALRQIDQLSRRFSQQLANRQASPPTNDMSIGALLLVAYPERLAQPQGPERLKLANGRGAKLLAEDSVNGWLAQPDRLLVVAELNQRDGDGLIRLAAGITRDELTRHFSESITERSCCHWSDEQQRIVSDTQLRYGQLVLEKTPNHKAAAEDISAEWLRVIRSQGLRLLNWSAAAEQLRWRIQLLQSVIGEPWPDCSNAALLGTLESWLAPYIGGVTTLAALQKIDVAEALRSLLPWPLPTQLNQLAPADITLPNGQHRRLDYGPVANGEPPVLAAKLQHLFGMRQTPRIANGQVQLMVHLLSPAQRPLQVTQDLQNFWSSTYAEVRKEMRGRYPKHDWPEKPY